MAGIERDEPRPESITFLVGGDASVNVPNLGADLDRGVRVGLEVVKPSGMGRLTSFGRGTAAEPPYSWYISGEVRLTPLLAPSPEI